MPKTDVEIALHLAEVNLINRIPETPWWPVEDIVPAVRELMAEAWAEGRLAMWSEGIDPYGIHMPPGDNPYLENTSV